MRLFLLLVLAFVTSIIQAKAQEKTIAGVVTSQEDNQALPGVSVLIKGTNQGTSTDANGRFQLAVSVADYTLVFSSIGFVTQQIGIHNQTHLAVQLAPAVITHSEIVVVGYGVQERKLLTSSVASVSAREIRNLPAPSLDQLLQGRTSGVYVSANSGEPGAGILVRIRGFSSIAASSEPLYVIDGVPIASGELAQIGAGSSTTNALADINAADIESIQVLKDASATAIYGARAANGVVLITTKRGMANKPVINFHSYYGISRASKDPNTLRVDGPTFERLQNEASRNNWIDQYGSINALDPSNKPYIPRYANPDTALNTNWLDEVFQTAAVRNHSLSIRGGNDRITYFLSGADYLQEGIIRPTAFERKSMRLNLDFLVSDKIKVGTSISYAATLRNRVTNGNDVSGALTTAFFYPSNIPVYKADGSYNKPVWENPVATVKETDYRMKTNRLIGNVFAEYTPATNLTLRTSWGIDNDLVDEYRYYNRQLNRGASVNGSAVSAITQERTWINENTLTYRLNLNSHSLHVLVGNTLQQTQRTINQAAGQQFPGDAFRQLTSAAVKTDASTLFTQNGLASVFSRVNYIFKHKYILTANVRADASSRFGANHRWGTFPALAIGWLVSEEKFAKKLSGITNLKLRASYGVTGNQNGINDFQSLGLWGGQRGGLRAGGGTVPINTVGSPAAYVEESGFTPNQLANPDLKWETTAQLDMGLDLGLFEDRLSFTFDYYHKQTKDLLLAVPVPRSIGYNDLVQNYGRIENKGWELSVLANPISKGNLNWQISANISRNRNKVTKLAAPFTAFSRDFIRVEEGYPLFSFWVHKQLGVDPQTGNVIWDTGDDEVFNPNTDRFIVGNAQPKFFGGFTNTLSFRNLDFSCFFQYSYGNDILNYNRYFFEHGGELTTGYMATQLDRWQKPGDVTSIPRMAKVNYATNLRPSRLIEDGSYLRLKNLELGYSLPMGLTNRLLMSKLRVYVSAQNLLTFTKYSGLDPEVSVDASRVIAGLDFATMPQPRILMGGINISF